MRPIYAFLITVEIFLYGLATSTILDVPIIDSVTLMNDTENTVELHWNISNGEDYNFTRYRVKYKSVSDTQYYEWPTQITNIEYNSTADYPPYSVLNSTSNFDCYNLCLQDPNCVYVVRVHLASNNCFLYSNHSSQQLTPSLDRQAMLITDITNPVLIASLPTNKRYVFQIALFDEKSGEWSKFSADSTIIDMTIVLIARIERSGITSITVRWEDLGDLADNKLSRCTITVSDDQDNYHQIGINDAQDYKLSPFYYDSLTTNSLVFYDPEDFAGCDYYAMNCIDCVFYASTFADDQVNGIPAQTCVLKKQLDTTNGVFGYENLDASSLRITSNQRIVDKNITSNGTYNAIVNCVNVYGSPVVSNNAAISLVTKSMNLSVSFDPFNLIFLIEFVLPEPIDEEIASYSINYSSNSFETSKDYYQMPTDSMFGNETYLRRDKSSCYTICAYSLSCKGFRYLKEDTSECYLTNDFSNPTPCDGFCYIKPKYNKQVIASLDLNKKICFQASVISSAKSYLYEMKDACAESTFDVRTNTSTSPDGFIEGQSATFHCSNSDVNSSLVLQTGWYFNGAPIDISQFKAELQDNNRTLFIKSLNHSIHDGSLSCGVMVLNGVPQKSILVESQNNITVEIRYPVSLRTESVIKVTVGADIDVPCFFDGYPVPSLNWTYIKNQEEIPGNYTTNPNSYTITFKRIQENDNGTYMCYVFNNASIYALTDIIVQSVPSKPKIKSLKQDDSKIEFSWDIADNGTLELKLLQIETFNNFSDLTVWSSIIEIPYDTTYNNRFIFTVDLERDVYLRIIVFNTLGASEPSDPILLKFKDDPDDDAFLIPFIIALIVVVACLTAIVFSKTGIHSTIYRIFCRKKSILDEMN